MEKLAARAAGKRKVPKARVAARDLIPFLLGQSGRTATEVADEMGYQRCHLTNYTSPSKGHVPNLTKVAEVLPHLGYTLYAISDDRSQVVTVI